MRRTSTERKQSTTLLRPLGLMSSVSRVMLGLLLLCSVSSSAFGQGYGTITGRIYDGADGTALPGANVLVKGTAKGAATNNDGKFRINQIAQGKITLVVRYLGYETAEREVIVKADQTEDLEVALKSTVIQQNEVVVTAQMKGQQAAINQQLTSMTISNVVARDRIQELPDNNAAESIGRLPGVSIQRDAGEGSKVIMRGMSPKYNPITIEGQKIPATDAVDRSVDLTMISSEMLSGIEVTKANTPDKDGDAIGGTVNFEMKKADAGWQTRARLEGGYSSQDKSYQNFRGSLSASNRFFNDALGVLMEGNFQRAHRPSDEFAASYSVNNTVVKIDNTSLVDRFETRDRFGGNMILDYGFSKGFIKMSTLYSRTERDETQRRVRYQISTSITENSLRKRFVNIDLLTNVLAGEYNFDFMKANWSTNYASTRQETPFQHDSRFEEQGAFNSQVVDQGPEKAIAQAKNRLDLSYFRYDYITQQWIKDGDFAGQLDFTVPMTLAPDMWAKIKFGGKYKDKRRDVDNAGLETESNGPGNILMKQFPGRFIKTTDGRDLMSYMNFVDDSFKAENFLNGRYNFLNALSVDKLQSFYEEFKDYRRPSDRRRFYFVDYLAELDDYLAGEKVTAAYAMAEIKWGTWVTVMPGVRYERTVNWYQTRFGEVTRDATTGDVIARSGQDTVGTLSYEDVLPMLHLRFNFTEWADLRLAVTKSISRPDYQNLVPRRKIDGDALEAYYGNPYIGRIKAVNYDAALSFYDGRLGLLGVGGFYKIVRDIDYIKQGLIKFYDKADPTRFTTYKLFQPDNLPYDSRVYGFECEIQTNFQFLPSPLDGILLNINFSRIFSKTLLPYTDYSQRDPFPPFRPVAKDTSRVIPMPGQSDRIANVTVGYEKGKFSARLSLIYQSNALAVIGETAEVDGYTDDYKRWDLTLQYKLPWHSSVMLSINNLTNLPDRSYTSAMRYPTEEKYFGWTAELGIRFEL
ncbi:MAG: TonB-dependent receptor [Ignavibacteriales bacterium]|nr:TonB-dependent receptor [Ignavibacteriales bacterium]